MSVRLPLWWKETARKFEPDNEQWYENAVVPLLEQRNKVRVEDLGLPPLSQVTVRNALGELRSYLMRQHGAALLSEEFRTWLRETSAKELSPCDKGLLVLIQEQENSPQELLKLQREMAGRLHRVPNKPTIVDRQFVELTLLRPAMREVMQHASPKKLKKRKLSTKSESRKKKSLRQ